MEKEGRLKIGEKIFGPNRGARGIKSLENEIVLTSNQLEYFHWWEIWRFGVI
jgi:hypothetical protein